jgi:glycosyltransferase involved in cell wall biosynthesis
LRIVFDVTPLSHTRTGVPNYVLGSLAGLAEAARARHEVVAFGPTSSGGRRAIEAALDGLPVEQRLRPLPFAHAWRTLWSRAAWPPAERFVGRFDVLHFSDWMYPPQRAGLRSTMVHDLVPLHFPQWVLPRTRRMHGAKYRNAARTCDLIFANSSYTAQDVVETLGVPAERLRVAPPGVDASFSPEGERADLARPYLFTVATLEPRKNLDTLAEAHRRLGSELALAVAGGAGWGLQPVLDSPDVIRLGFVPPAELPRYYRGAAVSVYPSRFEGFGMPVIEAMASGVPVVASSHPSLDEASGDAALRADPDSPDEFAAAIDRAVADRDELVRRGLQHASRFSWTRTGRVFLDAFLDAA